MSSTPSTPETEERQERGRVIKGFGAMAIVAGNMLGIGIFLAPPIVARHLPAGYAFFGLFIIAAMAALSGAAACAELGAMMPKAGGDYVFQRKAFGSSVAFSSGWVLFGAIFTGSVAALAVPVCQYQLPVLLEPIVHLISGPEAKVDLAADVIFGLSGTKLVAIGLVVLFTGINTAGAKPATWVQLLTTVAPMGLLTLGAIYAIFHGAPDGVAAIAAPSGESVFTLGGAVEAYMAVYFAFAGWNAIIYVAGEVKDPSKNIPLGLIGGTLAVTLLYLLLGAAFVTVLGYGGLAASFEAGTATATAVGGSVARILVTSLIAIALLASLNGTILGGARVAYAMAKGGALPKLFAHHNSLGVPARALWFQAAWACVLIWWGTFETLLSLVALAMMLCGSLTVASIYVLRAREPDHARPVKTHLALPVFYLLSSAFVIVVTIYGAVTGDSFEAWFPLFGLGLMIVVFVVHLIVRSATQRSTQPPDSE